MKVALVLLALVAVSQAAFTGTLQQRAKPLVDQAMFKLQLAGGRSGIAEFVAGLLKPYIDNILSEVQSTAAGMHAAASQHAQNLADMIESFGLNPQSVIAVLPTSVQNILNNLLNQNGKLDVSAIMGAVQTQMEAQIASVNSIIASMAQQAQALAEQLTVPNLLAWLQTQLQSRGFFGDLWDQITDAASGAWDTATGHVSTAWDHWTGVISTAAGTTMDTVSAMASDFIDQAHAGASTISATAAQEFEAFMSQFQSQLGDQWGQLQTEVAGIVAAGGNKPNGKRF